MSFQPYSLLSFQKSYVIIWSLSSFSFTIGLLNTILNLSSIDLPIFKQDLFYQKKEVSSVHAFLQISPIFPLFPVSQWSFFSESPLLKISVFSWFTSSMHHQVNGLSVGKLQEMVKERKSWCTAVLGVAESWMWLSN